MKRSFFWISFFAVVKKELIQTLRDRRTLTVTLIMQLFQMTMCGFIDVTSRDVPVVIVDQDHTSYSRELLRKVNATKTLKVKYVTDSPAEARALIRAGRATVGIVVPNDFHEKRLRRSGATILAMVDGSESSSATQALSAIDGLMNRLNVDAEREEVAAEGRPRPIAASTLVLFNAQSRAAYFLLPGLLSLLLVNFVFFTSQSFIRERESGTMERLVMTPLSTTGLVLGKVFPFALLGVANQIGLLLLMRWVFGVPIRGDVLLLLGGGLLYIFTILSIGVFIASKSVSAAFAGAQVQLLFLMGVFLSGYIWPLSSVPKPLLVLSYLHPTTHMVAILRGISIRDAHFVDLAPHYAYLLIAPIVFVVATVRRFENSIQT